MKLGFNLKAGLRLSKPGLYLAEIKDNHRVRKRSDGTDCLIMEFKILESNQEANSSEVGTLHSEWIPLKTFGEKGKEILLPSQQALAQLASITPGLEGLTGEEPDGVERVIEKTPGRKVVIDCRTQDQYLNLVAIYPPEDWKRLREKSSLRPKQEEIVPSLKEIETVSKPDEEDVKETEEDIERKVKEETEVAKEDSSKPKESDEEEIDWEKGIQW